MGRNIIFSLLVFVNLNTAGGEFQSVTVPWSKLRSSHFTCCEKDKCGRRKRISIILINCDGTRMTRIRLMIADYKSVFIRSIRVIRMPLLITQKKPSYCVKCKSNEIHHHQFIINFAPSKIKP